MQRRAWLGCGAYVRRSALRADFPAARARGPGLRQHKQSTGLFVSGLSASVPRPRRRTRFVRFALYAQTPAASQFTIRAAREAAGPALLGATALAGAVALARR